MSAELIGIYLLFLLNIGVTLYCFLRDQRIHDLSAALLNTSRSVDKFIGAWGAQIQKSNRELEEFLGEWEVNVNKHNENVEYTRKELDLIKAERIVRNLETTPKKKKTLQKGKRI